jgi:hypothetical protein
MSKTVAKKVRPAPSGDPNEGVSLHAIDSERKYLNAASRQRVIGATAALDPVKGLFALILTWNGARVSKALMPAAFQIDSGEVAFTTLKRRRLSVREVPLPRERIDAAETL